MTLPTVGDVNEQRVLKFKERITEARAEREAKAFRPLLETDGKRAERAGD